jgi:hypothetical protein
LDKGNAMPPRNSDGYNYRIYASNDPNFKCTDHMKVWSVLRKIFALA